VILSINKIIIFYLLQAKALQLAIEYDPSPPFDTGSPEKAPKELVELVRKASMQKQN
jgi:hypothetical protein